MGLKFFKPRAVTANVPAVRGLLASLGASVSLVAAGALALLAISAVIALEGWPGLDGGATGRTLPMGKQTVAGEPTDNRPVVLAEAPADDEPASGGGPTAEDRTPVADGPASAGAAPSAPVPDSGLAPNAGAPAPAPPPGSDDGSRPTLDPDEPVRRLTEPTDELLTDTGKAIAPVTDLLVPGSGAAVESLTGDLGDTVESTGGALVATLGLLLGRR